MSSVDVPSPTAAPGPAGMSPLRLGALATLTGLAVATAFALISIVDADAAAGAVAQGVGIGVITFAAGAVFVCALACLARRTLELVSLVAIVVAAIALDLAVIGVWLDVQNDAYGKVVGVAFVWTLVLFFVLALVLAASEQGRVSRVLFAVTALAYAAVGVLLSDLVLRGEDAVEDPFGLLGNGIGSAELRLLGAAFVIGAASWLATVTTARLQRSSG